jgi:hypothetical protein
MSEAKQEPTNRDQSEILREIKTLAETISSKNWREQKTAILKILETVNPTS